MLLRSFNSFISALVLLLALSCSVDASPASVYHRKVSSLQQLLRAEKKFCRSYLHGALPTQSTITATATTTKTLPVATSTVTNTVTLSASPVLESVIASTSIDTDVLTQTLISTSLAIFTSNAGTSTITSTLSTLFGTQEVITGYSTVSTTITTTSYNTNYFFTTVTATSTQPYRKRTLPAPTAKARSLPVKPKVVQSYPDSIITDACLLLLYGSFSKQPITSTLFSTVTSTPPPVTVTATPITIPATSTPTMTISLATTETLLVTSSVTLTSLATSILKATATTTETTISSYPYVFSGVLTTTTTSTRISTQYYQTKTVTTTVTASPTPISSGRGYIVVNTGDPSILGKYFTDNGSQVIFGTVPQAYTLDTDLVQNDSGEYLESYSENFSPIIVGTFPSQSSGNLLLYCLESSTNLNCRTGQDANTFYYCGNQTPYIANPQNSNSIPSSGCSIFTVEFVEYSTS